MIDEGEIALGSDVGVVCFHNICRKNRYDREKVVNTFRYINHNKVFHVKTLQIPYMIAVATKQVNTAMELP